MSAHLAQTSAYTIPPALLPPVKHAGLAWNSDLPMSGTVTHFSQDQEIYGDGDAALQFFKVASGIVRCCKFLDDGRRQIESFYVAGDLFGFENGADYSYSAEAVTDCTVIAYRKRDLNARAGGDDRLWSQIFNAMMLNLSRAQAHNLLLGRRTALEKVASFLITWADKATGGKSVSLMMTRQDIGDFLGLTIETVSRMLAQLEREGFIELCSARKIALKNLAGLREMNA